MPVDGVSELQLAICRRIPASYAILPSFAIFQGFAELIFEVPAFVEGFVDNAELSVAQPIEMSDDRVEFVDVSELYVGVQFAVGDANGLTARAS